MFTHATRPTVFALLALATHPALHAGEWNQCNGQPLTAPGGQVAFRLTDDWSPGSNFGDAFIESLNRWNGSAAAVDLSWYDGGAADPEADPMNQHNDVYWDLSLNGAAAVTIIEYSPLYCQILDTDIVFGFTAGFTTSDEKADVDAYGGDYLSFQAIAIHELGHALGLHHTADTYSCMGLGSNHLHANSDWIQAYPGEDAVTTTAAEFGYRNGTYHDLAVTHWRYAGYSYTPPDEDQGEYAVHVRTRLLGSGGSELQQASGNFAEPTYKVDEGDQVRLEVTVENLGKTSQNTVIGYYLSTNANITTSDTLIGSEARAVGPNVATTIISPVLTLPDSLLPDHDYWIGAVVDATGTLTEADEWNNRTYVGVHTKADPVDAAPLFVGGPANATAGSNVLLIPTIENIGGSFDGEYSYKLYLSTNSTITSGDLLLATKIVQSFGTYFDMVPLPATLAAGNYYAGIIITPLFGEVVTANNDVAGSLIHVTAAAPDLAAAFIQGPFAASHGQPVQLLCGVANVGGVLAGSYSATVRLSTDAIASAWLDLPVKSLSTSSTGLIEIDAVIPGFFAPGQYYWVLTLHGVAGELITTNNAIAGYPVTISHGPDIAALSISGPKQAALGQSIELTVNTQNLGDAIAGGYDCDIGLTSGPGSLWLPVHSFHSASFGAQGVSFNMPLSVPPNAYQWSVRVSYAGEYLLTNNKVSGNNVQVSNPTFEWP